MPIGTGTTDVGLLLSRSRAVGTRDIAFLLGLGLDLIGCFTLATLARTTEGDATKDNLIYIVTAKAGSLFTIHHLSIFSIINLSIFSIFQPFNLFNPSVFPLCSL